MNGGFPEYGAFVSSNKTLLSFELVSGGQVEPVAGTRGEWRSAAQIAESQDFPYCGFLINMDTLDICMDHHRFFATRRSAVLTPPARLT